MWCMWGIPFSSWTNNNCSKHGNNLYLFANIYYFDWKTELEIFQRFTLVAFFGAVSLFPFYIGEEIYFQRTVFNNEFFLWTIFAAVSPGIIAFTLYTLAQKQLGASLTGFTLYIFTVYAAIYGYILFDE